MPYWVHAANSKPDSGTAYTEKRDAVAARSGTETVSYVASESDREAWRDRERRRIRDNTYRILPWLDADGYPQDYYQHIANRDEHTRTPFRGHGDDKVTYYKLTAEHYAHLSLQSDGMIAYTPDDAHGIEDRQKRVRCGRYLELTAPWLTQEEKDHLCAMVRGMCGTTFQIARTPSDVRAVYRYATGFHSCMDARDFPDDDDSNPVSVYGDSDLGVAYLGSLAEKRVTARCVVWPEKLIATRVYGDVLLGCLLKSAGYSNAWSSAEDNCHVLTGAKLRAIDADKGRYVMPYIDGTRSVALRRKGATRWFECSVTREDDDTIFDAKSTDGYVGNREAECAHCGDTYSPDGDSLYCPDCDRNQWTCDRCDSSSFSDDANVHTTANGTSITLCESCDGDASNLCEECDESYYQDQRSRALLTAGRVWGIENREEICRDCLRAAIAAAVEITPETVENYLDSSRERWTMRTIGEAIGEPYMRSYYVSEPFDLPVHLASLSERVRDVLAEYGNDLDAKEAAMPIVFRALVASDYRRNHPELDDPQPCALPFGNKTLTVLPCADRSDVQRLIGDILTVRELGDEYSVYTTSIPFNTVKALANLPIGDRNIAPLSAFAVGQQYRIEGLTIHGDMLIQEIPAHVD